MSILTTLKEATHSRHVALEACSPLLDQQLSINEYKLLLKKFFSYYAPLERRLVALPPARLGAFRYSDRQKTRWLVQDLVALNKTLTSVAEFDPSPILPTLSTSGQVWGCLYVIEGATLGGKIISSHLRNNLGLGVTSGAAFFHGYGSQTGALWKTFCASLTDHVAQIDDVDQIVLGALQTFDTLGNCLNASPIALPVQTRKSFQTNADHYRHFLQP